MSKLNFSKGAAPSTVAAGALALYAKTDNLLYTKDENGVEYAVTRLGTLIAKNAVINGGMLVAQRADLTLGSSAPAANAGYGKVDRFQAWATGTSVSAGTATQDTASGIGRTGYALKLSGVTLTGTGITYTRHRIEALNSLRFKNQTASLSCRVKHDVGSSINYTLTVRKANTADTFSATTLIQAGSATSVASGSETLLTLEGISMGDCSNGIEIEVKAECGAVTTKNFWLTELQLEEGSKATSFEHVSFEQELARCLRYFEFCDFYTYGIPAYHYSTTAAAAFFQFKAKKRSATWTATMTASQGSYDLGGTISFGGSGEDGMRVDVTGTTATTKGYANLLYAKGHVACEL